MANFKPKPVKPVASNPKFIWSGRLDPVTVKPRDLPATAGIYAVIACDANGEPIKLPNEPARSRMKGVVYIGLTMKSYTLKNRFAALARAWRPKSKQKKPSHGSRDHYNKDGKARKLFKVEHVRIQYMPLPTDPKTDAPVITAVARTLNITTEEFRKVIGLELTGDQLVADSEAMAIQWFKRQHGYIPMLNRREEGLGDKPPTAAELESNLKKT
ncbi:MAG: hypothetical protein NTW87_03865 [Planctomycetota bacterium]|nr:hypothetical protein [Planctomycetota bacterium]